MRKNLDPFENHSDTEVWRALEEVRLSAAFHSNCNLISVSFVYLDRLYILQYTLFYEHLDEGLVPTVHNF